MHGDMMRYFDLFQPESVDGAVELLDRFGEDGWKLAGGYDSLDWFKNRTKRPRAVSLPRPGPSPSGVPAPSTTTTSKSLSWRGLLPGRFGRPEALAHIHTLSYYHPLIFLASLLL